MKNETKNGITTLTPTDGLWLTNGKTWSKCVYLAVNASPSDWTETAEEPPMPIEEEELTIEEKLELYESAYERGVQEA